MSQDNQFHQYGYDHYLKAPRKNRAKAGGFGSRIFESLQSPFVATGALLITGVVFATIIVLAYPSDDDSIREIPIVRADLRPIKSVPDDQDSLAFPNSDNTVLANIGQPRESENIGKVENLLAPSDEDFVSKEKALEQAMAIQSPDADPVEQALNDKVTPTLIQEAKRLEAEQGVQGVEVASAPNAVNVIQKIEENQITVSEDVSEAVADVSEVVEDKPAMHAAATSPETIEFVRNVLNADTPDDLDSVPAHKNDVEEIKSVAVKPIEKEVKEIEAKEVAKITPAAGAASQSINIQSGTYYVQLASITDRSRADKEYTKLQKKFSVLDSVKFRIQEASLDKGMFYRIQAGPMSKDSANKICENIKQQKPGGCLVTK